MGIKTPRAKGQQRNCDWLYTSNYSFMDAMTQDARQMYGTVRTTRGAPRFKLKYTINGTSNAMMPSVSMLGLPENQFRHTYMQYLDGIGLDVIRRELRDIQTFLSGKPLALLCFCKLPHPSNGGQGQHSFCHRRVFADWWKEKTGETILELGA